jgi:hypothetical protein
MPFKAKSLPAYRFHKARGQAVGRLSGRDHYLGPYGIRPRKSQVKDLLPCVSAEPLASYVELVVVPPVVVLVSSLRAL